MKILVVTTVFRPATICGGPVTVAYNLAKELIERGHEVTVVTSNVLALRPASYVTMKQALVDSIQVHYIDSWVAFPKFSTIFSGKLATWLREHLDKFDVVHVHFAREWFPFTVARAALARGIPLFLQTHGMLNSTSPIKSLVDRFRVQDIIEKARLVFALQPFEESELMARFPRAKISILPNGIRSKGTSSAWVRRNLEHRTVLYVGRIHKGKRVGDLVTAARILNDQGFRLRYRVIGPDGGDLDHVLQLATQLGVKDQFDFVGPLDPHEIEAELLRASVFALPSGEEQFPMAVIEALNFGVPTVITRGVRIYEELLAAGAVLVANVSAPSLADNIRTFFETPDVAEDCSHAAKFITRARYDLGPIVAKLEGFYIKNSRLCGTQLCN